MIRPPSIDQLRAMPTEPHPYWINHTNQPAEPAQQETTMGNANATTCFTGGYAGNAVCTTDAPTQSPIMQAITDLQQQIGECSYNVDELIAGIGIALRGESPETKQENPRPMMASGLAELIQQMSDSVRAIRIRVAGARERLTL